MRKSEIARSKKAKEAAGQRETSGQNLVVDFGLEVWQKTFAEWWKAEEMGQTPQQSGHLPRKKAEQPRGTPSNPGYQHYQEMVLSEEDRLG